MQKVLLIGDDPQSIAAVNTSLKLRWPDQESSIAATLSDGMRGTEHATPSLVLLYADVDCQPLAQSVQELRQTYRGPLIVLSHHEDAEEVVIALEAGADDYVRLPCQLLRLAIKMWALLGQQLSLTPLERQLLRRLNQEGGAVVSYETLGAVIRSEESNIAQEVDNHVQRLQRKLGDNAGEPRWISRVPNEGYRFIGPALYS